MDTRVSFSPLGVLATALVGVAIGQVTIATARAAAPLRFAAGGGLNLVIERSPLRVALVDRAGREEIGTVVGNPGTPLRPPGLDGPQPMEPLGAAGGFPGLGWVTGVNFGVENPAPPFTGNRLFGAETGVVVSATSVQTAHSDPTGLHVVLATDAGRPAMLDISRLARGPGVRLILTPPAGLQVGSSLATLFSPPSEGLYGGGTRRDAFDARGLLRNVWTE